MRKTLIIFLLLCSACFGDTFTSHLKPKTDSILDIGTSSLLWKTVYADMFTDGTALWQGNSLSGFTSISGATLTDTVLNITGGSVTDAVNGTFSGTLTAVTFTDSTATLSGGNLTGMGNVTGADVDISAGTGDYSSSGTGTFGEIVDNGLTASLGIYTDGSKQLTSTIPSIGTLGFWTRTTGPALLTTANAGDGILTTGTITGGTLTDGTASLTGGVGTGYTLNSPIIAGDFSWTGISTLDASDGSKIVSIQSSGAFSFKSSGRAWLEIIPVVNSLFFGNTTDNPAYAFMGSGTATFGGDVDVAGDINVQGKMSLGSGDDAGASILARFDEKMTSATSFGFVSDVDGDPATVATLNSSFFRTGVDGTGSIDTARAMLIKSPEITSGTIVNAFGIDIEDQTSGTSSNRAIKTGLGAVEFGDTVNITGVTTIVGIADGGRTNYDLKVGDTDGTPTYGMIQFGNAVIGRTSYKAGNIDLDGTVIVQNIPGPVTGEIEFVWTESTGDTCRFALPKSAVGNATYNSRSMFLAGPAPADTDFVKVSYWQGQGIFHNLVCDTSGTGADFGVQNDAEIEGDLFVDNIKESTVGAGITLSQKLITGSGRILETTRIDNGDSPYTILSSDHNIFCDTDGGDITVNLPAGVDGTYYRIINTGSVGNDVIVAPNGAELLDGVNAGKSFAGPVLILVYETTEGWW